MNGNVIRTITIRGTSEGLDKLQGDLNKLAAAHKGVTIATEETEKSTHALEQAMKRQSLRLDETARSLNNIARETKLADTLLKNKLIDDTRHGELLNLANQRYGTASKATAEFGKQTGLARHELINLGRQAQDVGVSLVSGQSPLMVLVQQGTQIADVFATSNTTVRGFFGQAVGFAGRFVASAGGMVTAVGGVAAALLYAASSADAANKAIDKVLTSGPGAASGLTRGSLNQIAQGAVGSGMNVNEARAAAVEFAKTGQIYEQNIKSATEATRLFAQAAGVDAADAAKQLAAALVDPSKGAQDLNKQFGFLDATLLNYIRTLQSQGKLQEAQAALLAGLTPTLQKQADTVDFLTATWRKADQAVIDFNKSIDKALGLDPKDLTTQLDEAMKKLQAAQDAVAKSGDLGVGPRGMKALQDAAAAAEAEVRRLEKAMADLNAQAEAQRLKDLSNIADAFTRALIPSIEQVEKLTTALSYLEKAKAAGVGGPNVDAALNIATRQLLIAQETLGVEDRKAQVFLRNAQTYSNVSASTAQILATLNDQLSVAQAIGVTAQQEAQYKATIAQSTLTLTDATAIADAQRAVAQAQINSTAELTLQTMRNQAAVSSAITGEERIRAEAQATYKNLLLQGVDAQIAMATAVEQEKQARAQATAQVLQQVHLMEQQTELIYAQMNGTEARVRAEQAYTNAIRAGAAEFAARAIEQATADNERAKQVQKSAQEDKRNDEESMKRKKREAEELERIEAARAQAIDNIRTAADAWKLYEQGMLSWSRANDEAGAANRRLEASIARSTDSMDGMTNAMVEQLAVLSALVDKWKYIPFSSIAMMIGGYQQGKNIWESGGQMTQFNPAGYTSQTLPAAVLTSMATAQFGPGGFDPNTGVPNAQGREFQFNRMVAGGGIESAFTGLLSGGLMSEPGLGETAPPQVDTAVLGLLQRSIDLLPKEQQIGATQQLVGQLEAAPRSLQTAELIKQLNDKLEQLTQATDANTSATSAMTDVLSPFYSSDPRRTHLGFRAFAAGGIMTQYGELPLRQYQSGGMATSPQVAVFGEGSTPEAYVPVPSGRIPVEIKQPANSNQRPVNVTINVQGNADANTVAALKATAFQQAQAMRRVMR